VQDNTPNCRTPRIALDSQDNMLVCAGWKLTQQKSAPWGSFLAQYVAADDAWTEPSRIISHLRTDVTVERPVGVWFDSADDLHLAWVETDTLADTSAVMYMKSLDWTTCVDSPSVEVADFIRGLCPEGDVGGSSAAHPLEATITVHDTSSGTPIPLAAIPAGDLYVEFSADLTDPPVVCTQMDSIEGSASAVFWCAEDADELPTVEATDASGQAAVYHAAGSGRARLILQAFAGGSHPGYMDTCWINSFDQCSAVGGPPDGIVLAGDFSAFTTAYVAWAGDTLENWTWDLVTNANCTVGQQEYDLYSVGPSDYGAFAAHYWHEYSCGKSKRDSEPTWKSEPAGEFSLTLLESTSAGDTLVYEVYLTSTVTTRVLELDLELPESLDFLSWEDGDFFGDPLRIGPHLFTGGRAGFVALAKKGHEPLDTYIGTVGTLTLLKTGPGDPAPSIPRAILCDEDRREYDLVSDGLPIRPAPGFRMPARVPVRFALRRPGPNPASSRTRLEFDVPRPGADVRIRVYDVQGRLVRTVTDSHYPPGYYSETWDLRNAAGTRVAPGIYFCRMEAGAFKETKKIVLVE